MIKTKLRTIFFWAHRISSVVPKLHCITNLGHFGWQIGFRFTDIFHLRLNSKFLNILIIQKKSRQTNLRCYEEVGLGIQRFMYNARRGISLTSYLF